MNKQITTRIIACGLVAVTLMSFAACKKKDKKETTTTTTTSKSAWLDETIEETTVITDENGNEKTYIVGKNEDGTTTLYEKVLDENGKVVKGDDGK